MRRRDRHFTLVLVALLALHVLTALCTVVSSYTFRRRLRVLSAALEERVAASEKSSIEAASTALVLADFVKEGRLSSPADDDGVVHSPPRVVGYGQSRYPRCIWIYRDVEQDGVVHREFLQRLPL